jgi:hypothetical protein
MPERFTAWTPTAIGSVSAASFGSQPFGTGIVNNDDTNSSSA